MPIEKSNRESFIQRFVMSGFWTNCRLYGHFKEAIREAVLAVRFEHCLGESFGRYGTN